tara:strand:- start:213 stop:608 length:396 start_codon:yes stop_codon:yes gene_type:complete
MANRDFKGVQALDREVKMIHGSFAIHATSGVTTLASGSVGVASVSAVGTGDVTITLDDKYNKFLGAHFTYLDAAAADIKKPIVHITAETVATTKTVVLQFSNADDGTICADADVGGDTVYFMIWVKNSSVT